MSNDKTQLPEIERCAMTLLHNEVIESGYAGREEIYDYVKKLLDDPEYAEFPETSIYPGDLKNQFDYRTEYASDGRAYASYYKRMDKAVYNLAEDIIEYRLENRIGKANDTKESDDVVLYEATSLADSICDFHNAVINAEIDLSDELGL